jgi:hypothetical protein
MIPPIGCTFQIADTLPGKGLIGDPGSDVGGYNGSMFTASPPMFCNYILGSIPILPVSSWNYFHNIDAG